MRKTALAMVLMMAYALVAAAQKGPTATPTWYVVPTKFASGVPTVIPTYEPLPPNAQGNENNGGPIYPIPVEKPWGTPPVLKATPTWTPRSTWVPTSTPTPPPQLEPSPTPTKQGKKEFRNATIMPTPVPEK